ncbi:hypothetical protein LUCX_250 [Xanthomonas phage vB_XciM_LucasX]|nr:hypothetical protein LUCX_250 [Xanthomonas phage vB_XciM_LucasX]
MEPITVFIGKALLCMGMSCQPVLVGPNTHPGQYQMHVLHTQQPGYGGDVLMYDSDQKHWFAIHRTYTLDKRRNRAKLYHGTSAKQRKVTSGCINVEPWLYEQLRENHRTRPLVILP